MVYPERPVLSHHIWRGGRVVERGGLENRFARKGNGGSNPSLSAEQPRASEIRCSWTRWELARSIGLEQGTGLRSGRPFEAPFSVNPFRTIRPFPPGGPVVVPLFGSQSNGR